MCSLVALAAHGGVAIYAGTFALQYTCSSSRRVFAWLPSCSSRRSRHVRAVARQTSLVRNFVQPCNSDRLDNSHIDRPVGSHTTSVIVLESCPAGSHTTCVFLFSLAFRIGKRACKSVAHTPCSYQHRMWSYRVTCYGPDPTPE